MRKIAKICLLFIGFNLCLFFCNFTQAIDYEFKNLDIQADVKIDGTVDIKETFTTNFYKRKHGIIRVIPLNYSVQGKDFHIDISDVDVKGSKFVTSKNGGEFEIKIGDANKTIIGEQIYPISYSTYGLIRNFAGSGYTELYWNLVGYDFDTNIDKVEAEIYLPKKYKYFSEDDFLITTDGKKNTVSEFEGSVDWSLGDKIVITYNKRLKPENGITLAIKFPKDYFEFDHSKQANLVGHVGIENSVVEPISFSDFAGFPWKYIFIVGAFLFSIFMIGGKVNSGIKKTKLESKIQKESPIVVRYSPPEGINCAEAGMLYNGSLEPTDLTSLIYKWAVEGLISIFVYGYDNSSVNAGNGTIASVSGRDTGFLMTKLKDIDGSHPWYEVEFFKSVFPGPINSKKVVSKTSEFDIVFSLKSLRSYGKSKGWLKVGGFGSINFGPLVAVVLAVALFIMGVGAGIIAFVLVVVCMFFGVIDADSSSSSPTQKKIILTEEGTKLASEVIGYAKFIQACDENKLRLFLKQDPAFFDKTLPYAVAFGFETSFIKKITPILEELDMRPIWLDGEIGEMNSISDTINDLIRQRELREARERERERRERYSSYDSDSGFDSGSSFSIGGFSSGGGGGGGGSRSW